MTLGSLFCSTQGHINPRWGPYRLDFLMGPSLLPQPPTKIRIHISEGGILIKLFLLKNTKGSYCIWLNVSVTYNLKVKTGSADCFWLELEKDLTCYELLTGQFFNSCCFSLRLFKKKILWVILLISQ